MHCDDTCGGLLSDSHSRIIFRQALLDQITTIGRVEQFRLVRENANQHIASSFGDCSFGRSGSSWNFYFIWFVLSADRLNSIVDGDLYDCHVKEAYWPWSSWRCCRDRLKGDGVPIHHGVAA